MSALERQGRGHTFVTRARELDDEWLPRLNALLKLVLLDLRGEVDEAEWARILRENHRRHEGKPPPRRQVDGKLLTV